MAPPSVASVPSLGVAVPTAKDNPPAATPLLSLLETIANQVPKVFANTSSRLGNAQLTLSLLP